MKRRIIYQEEPRYKGLRLKTIRDTIYIIFFGLITVGLIKHYQAPKLLSPVPVHAQEVTIMPQVTLDPNKPFIISPTPEVTEEPRKEYTWSEFINIAKKVAPMYNYPLKVLVAQAAIESGHGESSFARQRYNYFGIGAYDSDPNQAFSYENPEQCIIDYILTIKRNFPEAWDNRENPEQLVRLLKDNSYGMYYASDPNYVAKVMGTFEWRMY